MHMRTIVQVLGARTIQGRGQFRLVRVKGQVWEQFNGGKYYGI